MNDVARWLMAVLAYAATARAQFGGFGNGANGNPYAGGGSGSGSGSSQPDPDPGSGSGSSSSFGGPAFSSFGANFDFDHAMRVRATHGILGAIAMIVLFPGGAILMRVLPGRFAVWMHAVMEIISLAVLIAAVGMGIHLVEEVKDMGRNLMTDPSTSYHPIIGLVVMACLILQPALGLIHHEKFKRLHRRQIWSYLHLFNGRVVTTLGIVNGALGLWMARASSKLKTAYVAAAATMWVLWMLTALWSEWKRWRKARQGRKLSAGDVSFY